MNLVRYITVIFASLSFVCCDAQSFIFGPKLGPLVALQQWNGLQRDALFGGHVALFIESYDEEDNPSSLFAQLGYHQRGSAERSLVVDRSLGDVFRRNLTYKFNNISLMFGAKRLLKMESQFKPFYTLGVRFEYTVSTNLDRYQSQPYFPSNEFVNKFNYGFSAGGGFQYQFGDLIGGTIELTLSPDLSKQYEQFPIPNIVDPRNVGNTRTLPMQEVRNLSLELSVSLRLLRKVEYY